METCEEADDYADYLLAPGIQSGGEVIVSGDLDLPEATGLPAEVLTPRDALAPSVDNRSQAAAKPCSWEAAPEDSTR